jgi:predicted amidophosphoribosyltransferase
MSPARWTSSSSRYPVGQCGRCLFNTSGPAELCFTCARRTMEPLAPSRCRVCDRPYAPDDESECGNPLCNRDDRQFSWNFAISMRTGQLKTAINRYKYDGKHGWAYIFGRVVAGFLEEEARTFEQFDVITASPTYVGPDGRTFDHTRKVLERAAAEVPLGSEWPFDIGGDPLIVKSGPTPSMVGHGFRERRDIAEGPLRDALRGHQARRCPREWRARLRRRVHRRADAERGRPCAPEGWRCRCVWRHTLPAAFRG